MTGREHGRRLPDKKPQNNPMHRRTAPAHGLLFGAKRPVAGPLIGGPRNGLLVFA